MRPPPRSLLVEVVASAPQDGAEPVRALAIKARREGVNAWRVGALGAMGTALVVAPGMTTVAIAALYVVNVVTVMYGNPRGLILHDTFAIYQGKHHLLTGITDVSLSLNGAWIWRGARRALVFEGSRRQISWVADLVWEVAQRGKIPGDLMLPAATVRGQDER